jgi:hypothetical protein
MTASSAKAAGGGRLGQAGEDLVRVVSETLPPENVSLFIASRS